MISFARWLSPPSAGLLLLSIAALTVAPHLARAQNCTYHAEGSRGDWVDCGSGGGGGRPAPRNLWSAIAISPATLMSGIGYAYPNRAAAERRALAQCAPQGRGDCKIVMWVENRCMAVATGTWPAYGAAGGSTRAGTQQSAIEWCRKGGGQNCSIDYVWCP